jgi:hypothetical protein
MGPRPITDVNASDIGQLTELVKATTVKRRNARGGRGAAEHLIAALRCMYEHAVADGILTESENPAARVPKPRRLLSTRRALPDSRLEETFRVAATTGDDPALDALLLRLHTENACRRGGALALASEDLDAEHCLIQLHEKGETVRWQYGQTFPEGSFGIQNRQAIAAREMRVATRLRAVERAYRMANEHHEAFRPPEPLLHLITRPTGRLNWSRSTPAMQPPAYHPSAG